MSKNIVLGLLLVGSAFGGFARAQQYENRDSYEMSRFNEGGNQVLAHPEKPSAVFEDDWRAAVTTVLVGLPAAKIGAWALSTTGLALAATPPAILGLTMTGAALGGWFGFRCGDYGLRDDGPPAGDPFRLLGRMLKYPFHRNCNTRQACKVVS